MSIPAAMLTEMQGQNRVHPTFDVTLAGTTYLFAEEAIASESQGFYTPDVLEWGGFKRAAGHVSLSLERPRATIRVRDPNRVIQKALGGPARRTIRGSTCSTTWRSFHVAAASHWKDFQGIVDDVQLAGDRVYEFTVALDLAAIDREPRIPRATAAVWPTLPAASEGADLPLVFGQQLSTLQSPPSGRITCVPLDLDSSGNSPTWCYGLYGATVHQVWVDDAIRDDWTMTRLFLGADGHTYSIIKFTGSEPLPTAKVKADVAGLRETGPSTTGPIMENPALCIRTFLGNFVIGDFPEVKPRGTVNWNDESSIPIDTAGFDAAETFYDERNIQAGFVVFPSSNSLSVFNNWCRNFNAVPYIDDPDKVGAIPEDNAETGIYASSDAHIKQRLGDARPEISMTSRRAESFNELEIKWGPDGNFSRLMRDELGLVERKQSVTYDMIDDTLVDR